MLVKDGMLDVDAMMSTRVSRPELFKELRSKEIYQLGKAKRVYIEASGDMSIYKADEEKPGLSVLPSSDKDIQQLHKKAGKDVKACCCCGNTQTITDTEHMPCNVCYSVDWVNAVL